MASIYDVDPTELIEKAAVELAKNDNIKPPEWASFVKTGAHRERVPARRDWWYVRAAAVLRTIYRMGPIGVAKLRVRYGGKKRRGYQPPEFRAGSGNIIRKILQQLEKAGFLKKEDKSQHKGRCMTPKGKSFLDKIATQIYKGTVKQAPKVEEKAPEVKEAVKAEPEKKHAPKEAAKTEAKK